MGEREGGRKPATLVLQADVDSPCAFEEDGALELCRPDLERVRNELAQLGQAGVPQREQLGLCVRIRGDEAYPRTIG